MLKNHICIEVTESLKNFVGEGGGKAATCHHPCPHRQFDDKTYYFSFGVALGGDDTALNSVMYRCRREDNWKQCKTMHASTSFDHGDWSDWKECPHKYFICGVQTRVEEPQGSGDDTALNDIQHQCCKLL